MYRLVFWQNCLSPHQLPYIVHLLDDKRVDEVDVITDEKISEERKKMGWDLTTYPGLEKCKVIIHPNDSDIHYILSKRESDSIHFFSGINAYPFISRVLRISLYYKIKRALITEKPNTFKFGFANAKPLWMHKIRFLLKDKKYANHIDYVFAMGEDAVKYFRSVHKGWKVFPFLYCTRDIDMVHPIHKNNIINIVYIGTLSWWKNPLIILKAIKTIEHQNVNITYVGDGPLRKTLEQYIQKNKLNNVNILGYKKSSQIDSILEEQDILILPSKYDGWGAVVNEALTSGLYIICSDNVGAKELLLCNQNGQIFKNNNSKQLAAIIEKCILNRDLVLRNRENRIKWSKQCISGKVVSKYLIDCLDNKNTNEPWLK